MDNGQDNNFNNDPNNYSNGNNYDYSDYNNNYDNNYYNDPNNNYNNYGYNNYNNGSNYASYINNINTEYNNRQKSNNTSFLDNVLGNNGSTNSSSPKKNLLKRRNLIIFILFIIIELGFSTFYNLKDSFMISDVIFKYTSSTQATVKSHNFDHKNTTRSGRRYHRTTRTTYYYKPVVEFEYNGKTYVVTPKNDAQIKSKLPSVGSRVYIKFDPSNPNNSFISKGKEKYILSLILLIVSSILNIALMIILICKIRYELVSFSNSRIVNFAGEISMPILYVAIGLMIVFDLYCLFLI